MTVVYIGLGSNLGQKENFLKLAISEIEKQIGHITAQSAFYNSAPWGFESPNSFINACVAAETVLNPQDCLHILSSIEQDLGRTKKTQKGYQDRVIDLDILLYGQKIIKEDGLIVPHPLMHQRLFVLEPLVEIAPDFVHPILKKSIRNLLEELSSQS
jgi:2-amino-4-hydroxy-6-hydroxymethyldihydropteridine pyrophosphokinase